MLAVTLLVVMCAAGTSRACDNIYPQYGVTGYVDSHEGYPTGQYGSDVYECWYIYPSSTYSIKLWLDNDFDIEYHSSCSYDYLRIDCQGGGSTDDIGRFCGTSNPLPVSDPAYGSPDTTIYVVFDSNTYTHGNGFRLYYSEVDGRLAHDCGWNSTDYSSSSEGSERDNGSSSSTGAIIGIVFGVIGGLALLACIGAICKKSGHWETRKVWVQH